MLTSLILAGSLPLVAINANDARLEKETTFVSEQAMMALQSGHSSAVLCLDRPVEGSICLDRQEWDRAVARANARTNLLNHNRVLNAKQALNR